MVLGGGLWMGGQAWAFSGPEEKPADTSSRQVEGFYLGCRWIASPKDIPVPEKKIKEWENLLDRVKMIDKGRREFMIQLWTLTYQSEQFRKKASEAKRNRVILAGRRANKEREMNGRAPKGSEWAKMFNPGGKDWGTKCEKSGSPDSCAVITTSSTEPEPPAPYCYPDCNPSAWANPPPEESKTPCCEQVCPEGTHNPCGECGCDLWYEVKVEHSWSCTDIDCCSGDDSLCCKDSEGNRCPAQCKGKHCEHTWTFSQGPTHIVCCNSLWLILVPFPHEVNGECDTCATPDCLSWCFRSYPNCEARIGECEYSPFYSLLWYTDTAEFTHCCPVDYLVGCPCKDNP
ncbi:MAG: hypothetical protein V2G37_08045 [bacterium JZ-2024 1]